MIETNVTEVHCITLYYIIHIPNDQECLSGLVPFNLKLLSLIECLVDASFRIQYKSIHY